MSTRKFVIENKIYLINYLTYMIVLIESYTIVYISLNDLSMILHSVEMYYLLHL